MNFFVPNYLRAISTLIVALLCVACSEITPPEKSIRPVASVYVGSAQNTSVRTLSGYLQPAESTELSFEHPGRVQAVYVDFGESFKRNQVLAKLDATTVELTVKERESQLSNAATHLKELKADYQRKANLLEEGAVSRSEYDSIFAAYQGAQDQLNIAKVRFALAQEELSRTLLKAPYDGTVAARYVEPSQRVQPNQRLFQVQGNGGLEVALEVPESLLKSIDSKQSVVVRVPSLNLLLQAKVKEIATSAESANSFPVSLQLNDYADTELRAGMSAEADFTIDNLIADKSYNIPLSAFLADKDNNHFVYALKPKNNEGNIDHVDKNDIDRESAQPLKLYTVHKKPISIAQLTSDFARVSSGLAKDDHLVSAGLAFLKEGQTVTLLNGDIALFNP